MVEPRVLLLMGTVAVVGANSLMLSPIATSVAASFAGTSPAGVMTASACYGIGVAVSALAFAPAIDRIGAAAALTRAIAVLMLALLASAAAPSLIILCAAQAIAGLAAGTALPAAYGLSAQIAPPDRQSEALGMVLSGWTISLVAGVSLAAAVADITHWRVVFGLLCGCALLILTGIRLLPNWGSGPGDGQTTSPLTAFRVPGIVAALAVCAAYMTAFYGAYSFVGPHVTEVLGRSTPQAGLIALSYGIGFGLAVPFGKMIDRLGAPQVAAPAFLCLALTYLALAAASSAFWAIIAVSAVWGLVNHIGLNLIVGRLTALDPAQRGAVMGLYSAVTYGCMFAGALAFRPLFEVFGWHAAALVAAACVVPAIVDGLRLRRPVSETL